MSGGRLVVLDRAGRGVKQFPLAEGLATLGSDPACDIRIMLPTVSPHHATVVVHTMQTVVRSVSERETLVNGAPVSVAALRHGDLIALGGRTLRWEYCDPARRRPLAPQPALQTRVHRARAARRGSEPPPRDVIVPSHRDSMPAATSGRQVAIVQPQRRDTSDLSDAASSLPPNKRPRTSKSSSSFTETVETNGDKTRRKVNSPRNTLAKLSNPTKATLWIESRKSSPRKSIKQQTPVKTPAKTPVKSPAKTPGETSVITRGRTPKKSPESAAVKEDSNEKSIVKTPVKSPVKVLTPLRRNLRKVVSAKKSTPLRMVVLKKAQSAHKMRVTKIQAPLKMDSTKQAAIMLMTRHTPKSKQPSPQGNKGPSYIVKKPSPVRKTPKQAQKRSSARQTPKTTPKRSSSFGRNQSASSKYDSLIEITDSESTSLRGSNNTRRSGNRSSIVSPLLPSPKKSALKDPTAKKSQRKTESIKFDLSNLENTTQNRSSDVMLVDDTPQNVSDVSESDITLHYSDTSNDRSPRARASISSRSDRMIERSIGSSYTEYPKFERRSGRTASPQVPKSPRGINMVKKALETSDMSDISSYSRRTTKSLNPSNTSTARLTQSLSPRATRNNLESYSIVDLVSIDDDSYSSKSGSVYNSAGSVSSNATYDTPLLGSSTPYSKKNSTAVFEMQSSTGRTRSRALVVATVRNGQASMTSDIVTTPENTEDATKTITFNSTRISRASKSRSRINDSVSEEEVEDSSPKSSKRLSKVSKSSPLVRKNLSVNETPSSKSDSPSSVGMHTPENRHSPVEANTPVLNIQSLLDASQNLQKSPNRRNLKRKTIGVVHSEPRSKWKSKSLNIERSLRGRDISVNFDGSEDNAENNEGIVTPTSAVKLVPEAVKNKHSTAKKPKSKRSLIDDLDESDIVKQLFNSPVKRKLSQSMTEFSRKQLFEDEEERPTRLTRSAIAIAGTPDNSITDHTEIFTRGVFVSPLNTPTNSPNMTGIKRLFQKCTPDNDLRNIRGVKGLLRTPRARKSIRNDLTNVKDVKAVFARSPRNRLSDVRVKNLLAASPKNDLRRVSGIKALFQSQQKKRTSPRNELDDMRGVRTLFRETRNSPRNDLSDVRGVKQMFRQQQPRNELSDMSGVEQLFHETDNLDTTFDQLMGRPPIRATYIRAKSYSTNRVEKRKHKKLGSKSLHDSISQITNNVEEWLENELRNRVQKEVVPEASTSKGRKSTPNTSKNVSKMILPRELQKLTTDTVEGNSPVLVSRTRNSSVLRYEQSDVSSQKKSASELYSAHTLPIKKRSFVNASIKTTNTSVSKSNKLPIKKRAVVHSTPVKGRVNITMNASEIGRMSPISSADKTSEVTIIGPPPALQMSPKNRQSPKTKAIVETLAEDLKPSPKRPQNTPKGKVLRGRKTVNENQEVLNTKKRRSSLVITKKAPVLSPKPAPRATRRGKVNKEDKQEAVKSPRKTRSTRGQKSQVSVEAKIATPKKNTRAKVSRKSVVVVKPSPKLKPRATRRTKDVKENTQSLEIEQPQIKQKGKRKTAVIEPKTKQTKKTESLKESQVAIEPVRKTRKTNTAIEPKTKSRGTEIDVSILVVQTRRTRNKAPETEKAQSTTKKETKNAQTKKTLKITQNKTLEEPKAVRSRGRNVEPQASVESEPPRRGRRAKTDIAAETTVPITRGRKTVQEELPKTAGRSRKTLASPPVTNKKTKTKVNESAPEPTNTGRGRKRKNTEPEETIKEIVKATKQTRSTKAVVNTEEVKQSGKKVVNDSKKGGGDASSVRSREQESVVETRRTRKAAQQVKEQPVRGKKVVAVAEATQQGARKKRTNVEISDAKDTKKQPAKKARTTRTTRRQHDGVVKGVAGR